MRRTPAVLLAALAVLVFTPAARAAGSSESEREASRHFKRGVEFFKSRSYPAALVEFRRAYELAPNFSVLYNVGQIQYLTDDYAGALVTFTKYLDAGGARVPAARRSEVEKDIQHLKDLVAYVGVSTAEADAEVTVDDEVVGRAPLAAPVTVNVGRHRIGLRRDGRELAAQSVEPAAGDHLKVTLEVAPEAPKPPAPAVAQPPPTPPPAPPSHEAPPHSPWPTVAWVGAGTLAAGTAVTGVLALRAYSTLKDDRGTDGVSRATLDSDQSHVKTLALVTDILGATTALTAGVALYLTLSSRKGDAAVAIVPGVGGLRVKGTW